ncbi:hypothetical protein MKW98_025474 [Papaver atlanticum]|uniref:F-box domain-containing protein n=1 Tax=Papaver atlanticum TaxID=357466 RepID=A0AAD4SC76_9MAGN|nr:hypothetical protein MKW98_025474 [Papaver atlanticum]
MEEPRNSPICNSIDRISNLPENLIHHIMFFMDMTYVVQTCVLSKRWKHLWTNTPNLNFDFNVYSLGIDNRQYFGLPSHYFIKFVDQVFILRDNSNIQKVNLVCGVESNPFIGISAMTASLTTWIVAAVRRNIQEFYLDISAVKISRFPQCLFTCTSLIKLELKLGGNSSIIVLPTSMDLPRLTFMKLDSLLSTDVNLTNRLFLKLDFVSKTSSKVKIDAPNLVSFKCRDYVSKCYVLENLASLVTADINVGATKEEAAKIKDYAKNNWLLTSALSSVKELRLTEAFLCICKICSSVSAKVSLQFSNLRFVKLETFLSRNVIRALGWLFYMSPNIESLAVVITGMPKSDIPDNEDYWAGVSPDHLRSVEIRGLTGHFNNELKFVEILFKKAVILENMVLFSCKKSMTDKRLITFREKLPTLPRASSNVATFLI